MRTYTSSIRSNVARAMRGWNWADFWDINFIPKWLPCLLGLGLGLSIAIFIVDEAWVFVFALLLLVPTAILLNTYPFVTVIIWLLLMPVFAATPTRSMRYVYWMLYRAMIPVGLGIAVLSHLLRIRDYPPVRLGPAELAIGLFMGLVLASVLLFQPGISRGLIEFYDRILVPYCMYLLVRLTTPREKEVRKLVAVALVIALSQSIVGLLSWFSPQVLPPHWLKSQGYRTAGTLGQPAVYSAALVFSITLLFQAAMNRKPGLLRSVFLLAFNLGAVCVFFSFSRGSWLGGLFVVIGLLFLFPKPMVRTMIVILAILAVLGGGLLASEMAWASERLQKENTIQSRIANFDAMLAMIKLKPLFGWGYGNVEYYSWRYIRFIGDIGQVGMASHNTFLTVMAELGLVGFSLYMFPFVWWLVLTIRVWPRMPKRGLWSCSLLNILWLTILNYIVVSNFIDMRFFPFGITLEWMTLGLVASIVFPYLEPSGTGGPRWIRRAID